MSHTCAGLMLYLWAASSHKDSSRVAFHDFSPPFWRQFNSEVDSAFTAKNGSTHKKKVMKKSASTPFAGRKSPRAGADRDSVGGGVGGERERGGGEGGGHVHRRPRKGRVVKK